MPYCVSCGVELNRSAKRCPLCDVEVVLPAALVEPATGNSLPQQRDIVASAFDRKLWIQVVSVLMAVPALMCVVINAVLGEGMTWSLYVVASLGTAWVWCVSPFLYRRNIVPLWITIDATAFLGLLYVIDYLWPAAGWFLPLALPITLCLDGLLLLVVVLTRRGVLRELHVVAAALMAFGVFCMAIEGAVDLYVTHALTLQWSLLVLVSCSSLALIATLLQQRRGIVEGMKFWFRM